MTEQLEEIIVPDNGVARTDQSGKKVVGISGDAVTVNTSELPEEHRDLVRWLYGWIRESNFSYSEAALHSSIDQSTLYKLFTDKYRDEKGNRVDLTKICERIKRLKLLAEERSVANRTPFVETGVFRKVESFCREALVTQMIGMIYGESQIGKTCALREVQRRNNHGGTVYVLVPAGGGKNEFIKAVAAACRISTRSNSEDLRGRIQKHLDPTKLLIFDEMHEMFLSYPSSSMQKCLGIIRQWQEKSQCGVILCGTNAFRNEMEEGKFAHTLNQLRRRGIWELQLEDVASPADMALIASLYNLARPTGEAAEQVKYILKDHGLGKFCKFLARGAQKAAKEKRQMSWDYFMAIVGAGVTFKTKPNAK